MTRRAREIETLLLTMFAAVPLYFTYAIKPLAIVIFHLVMTAIVIRVMSGRTPELVPARLMRWVAIAYIPFYVLDAAVLSGSAIAASTHLVLFIAIYQPIEAMQRENQGQRLLTTSLIFVASLATSTHISIVLFVGLFAFLMFRQLMYLSHLETTRLLEQPYAESPSAKTAGFYLIGAALLGAIFFPLLPRLRNPFVQGLSQPLPGSATALSETINFNEPRITPPDSAIVARVWLDQDARPFFTPLRLRGRIYDRFEDGEWQQSGRGIREIPSRQGTFFTAKPAGVRRRAIVELRPQRGRIFLPVGTFEVTGVENMFEGPSRETYSTYQGGVLNLEVLMAYEAEPLRVTRIATTEYPITPEVLAMARRIVGAETDPSKQAARIEQYMLQNFRYLQNPATPGEPMTLDDFLLRRREGHCEYFAAGMVALLTALDVPARIAGGFYGGQLNSLTGYYAIRREDAHAWTEVWDGVRWATYDATPAALRPGAQGPGFLRAWLSSISDSISYFWDRYVLTFGLADQIALAADTITWARDAVTSAAAQLRANLREVTSARFLIWLVGVIAIGMVLLSVAKWRQPVHRALERYLALQGIELGPSMTMEEGLRQLRERNPESANQLEPLIAMYEEERFSTRSSRARVAFMRKGLAQLRG